MTTQLHFRAAGDVGLDRNDGDLVRPPRADGFSVDVDAVSRRVRDRRRGEVTLVDAASLLIAAGELVAIVGPSGAGKTTLLETIAGVAEPTEGSVRFDGVDVHANRRTLRGVIGYVPQEDTIHADLPLERTLRYAARLRLPSSTTSGAAEDAVRRAIATVGLTDQSDVRVGALSGGQRKRASIAVELLTEPRVFFLDEPTSGLDPSTSAELVAHLRTLADRSATVVFTTHSVEDLARCDRIVFMARGGRVAFVGTIDAALARFGVDSVAELYRHLAEPDISAYLAGRVAHRPGSAGGTARSSGARWLARSPSGACSPGAAPRRSCATR